MINMVLKPSHDVEKVIKKKFFCSNNKRRKQTPFSSGEVFKFSDYDCIAFDLDNTICRYKVGNMMRMEYRYIAEYLVDRYGYDPSLLLPLDEDMDFMQKGILMDIKRGNFLKCATDGRILKAAHGTCPMTEAQIDQVYGLDRIWQPVIDFMGNFYDQSTTEIRSFKDYFDLPAGIACARAIDIEDRAEGGPPDVYDVWPDVHVAMCSLYRREYFRSDQGGFFPQMKLHPEKYVNQASERLKRWLKALNEHTFTFLISGSSIDYASHIAQFVLGSNWRDYFDMTVFTAKKPGFFTGNKPFLELDGIDDGNPVAYEDLCISGTYANGNWADLKELVRREAGTSSPHALYVGDHLSQDVFTPTKKGLDTVAIVEELAAEGIVGESIEHSYGSDLMSSYWGSFWEMDSKEKAFGVSRVNTLYGSIPVNHSRMTIPFLEVVARYPIRHEFSAFSPESSGFFPGDPVVLHF